MAHQKTQQQAHNRTQQQGHNRPSAKISNNSDYGLTNPHNSKLTIELLQVFQPIRERSLFQLQAYFTKYPSPMTSESLVEQVGGKKESNPLANLQILLHLNTFKHIIKIVKSHRKIT